MLNLKSSKLLFLALSLFLSFSSFTLACMNEKHHQDCNCDFSLSDDIMPLPLKIRRKPRLCSESSKKGSLIQCFNYSKNEFSLEEEFLHDENFKAGFEVFLKALNTLSSLEPKLHDDFYTHNHIREDILLKKKEAIDEIENYLKNIKINTIASKFLIAAQQYLSTGDIAPLYTVCKPHGLLYHQATKGSNVAKDILSLCYLHGVGVQKDTNAAEKWSKRALRKTTSQSSHTLKSSPLCNEAIDDIF